MPFPTAVAGPSRLPFQPIARAAPALISRAGPAPSRSYSTPSEAPSDAPGESGRDFKFDPSPSGGEGKGRTRWTPESTFHFWKHKEGPKWRFARKGEKAKWLGGDVPYPTNPSFAPPPPLSDYTMSQVYAEIVRGVPVNQLANKYNISKARIEAVRKLKEVEDEYERRSIPLQRAFLDGMEPLLGVMTPLNPVTRKFDPVRARELDRMEKHPSVAIEQVEEQRWESGIGEEGAFGTRSEAKQGGIEKTTWEWRDEEAVVEDRARLAATEAAIKSRPDHKNLAAEVINQEVSAASFFTTPASEQFAEKQARDEAIRLAGENKGTVVNGVRVIDTSITKGKEHLRVIKTFKSDAVVAKKREKRHRKKEGSKKKYAAELAKLRGAE
ncbi:hypothetical protein IAT38_005652 [Cryptococcus sp. DSM 104549]